MAFPKLNRADDGRSNTTGIRGSARTTTTRTTPDRARTVRTQLMRDQVSRGSILERYRGPAGRRLDPTPRGATGTTVADRTRGSSSRRSAANGRTATGATGGRSAIDVSRGRGLSDADTALRPSRGGITRATGATASRIAPEGSSRGTSRGTRAGARRSAADPSSGLTRTSVGEQLSRLERARTENPGTTDRLRRQTAAARRMSDIALRTSLSASAGLIGRYGGFGVGIGGGYGGGYIGGTIGGSTNVGFNLALNVGFNSCWWATSCYWPSWNWCYPYYRSYCYWYGSPYYCWPRYAFYTPIYSTFPVYYDGYYGGGGGGAVVVDDGAGEVVVAADEEVVPVDDVGGAEPSNPRRTEELARAASQYLRMGDHAFREGRYGDAVHFYAKSIEYAPGEGVLYLILSDALFATGDYHYAAYAIRKAAELDAGLFDSPVDKHSFYGDPDAFDKQLAVLESYLEDHYLDDDARLVLATNYLFGDRANDTVELLRHPFSEGVRDDGAGAIVLESAVLLQASGR